MATLAQTLLPLGGATRAPIPVDFVHKWRFSNFTSAFGDIFLNDTQNIIYVYTHTKYGNTGSKLNSYRRRELSFNFCRFRTILQIFQPPKRNHENPSEWYSAPHLCSLPQNLSILVQNSILLEASRAQISAYFVHFWKTFQPIKRNWKNYSDHSFAHFAQIFIQNMATSY